MKNNDASSMHGVNDYFKEVNQYTKCNHLHILSFRWVWVVAVAIARTDFSIFVMDDMLCMLVDGGLTTGRLCFSLCGVNFGNL